MSTTQEILKTKEYELFKFMKGNRQVDNRHVNALIASMKEKYYLSPIQVNEKMEIIDGAHRYTACKALKLPVYYYIAKGTDLKTIQVLNSNSKDWKIEDYLQSWITQGNKDYIQYKQFQDAYSLSHKINLLLLTGQMGSMGQLKDFENGAFKIKDLAKATEVAAKIMQVEPLYKGYKRRNFVYALCRCLKNKSYNHDTFIHKLSYQQRKMVDCSSVEQYMDLIQEIYNYSARAENRISIRGMK